MSRESFILSGQRRAVQSKKDEANSMIFRENLKGKLTDEELFEVVQEILREFKKVKKVLLIHPDYTRNDFSHKLVPLIYRELKARGMKEICSLNAGGTHRRMSEEEIRAKLGISSEMSFSRFYNHEYNDPNWLVEVGEIPASFVAEKTEGELEPCLLYTSPSPRDS